MNGNAIYLFNENHLTVYTPSIGENGYSHPGKTYQLDLNGDAVKVAEGFNADSGVLTSEARDILNDTLRRGNVHPFNDWRSDFPGELSCTVNVVNLR